MERIAIIGSGALAQLVIRNFNDQLSETCQLVGIYGIEQEVVQPLAQQHHCKGYTTLQELLEDKPNYTIEIAAVGACKAYAEEILASGSHLIIVSVGALADQDFKERIEATAKQHQTKIYVVSGAIGGFDLMQVFHCMGNSTVSIESTKAPKGLNGAPYLNGRILSETEAETVFEGNYIDAIHGFPKNVNVAVATALASSNPNTKVIINSQPGSKRNQHKISLDNELIHSEILIQSYPDPANPRSSVSAGWSVIALLKSLTSSIIYF